MMLLSVAICIGAFVALVAVLRIKGVSLGMPIAYLAALLLIHVPGAVAHLLDANDVLPGPEYTELGIGFTAIGALCFVAGVWLSQRSAVRPARQAAFRPLFWQFCLWAGWTVTSLGYMITIPTIGAVIEQGGPIWMLACMLGLRTALGRSDSIRAWKWLGALAVFPLLMLLLGGFVSYGSAAVIVVFSALAISTRSRFRVAVGTMVAVMAGMSVFLSYFQNRNAIRAAVWGGLDTESRIEASMGTVRDIEMFSPSNRKHLEALDLRLNQNFFAGVAATRIEQGKVDYLYGKSLTDGVLSLIPRALWPDKPIVAGSGRIVAEMTGLRLSTSTSFGVGNVMEFQINFGIPGIIAGFLTLGLLIGWLDRRAAEKEEVGDLGGIFVFFLPAVALIQPNGSMVELMGGSVAALAAGYAWKWGWTRWPKPIIRTAPTPHPPTVGNRAIRMHGQPRQAS